MNDSTKFKKIEKDIFDDLVVAQRSPAILVFGAEWSGNSEIMDSMISRISGEFNHGIHFLKVDLEEDHEISKFFGVFSVPTIIMMKDGEVKEFMKGFVPAHKIRQIINDVYLSDK